MERWNSGMMEEWKNGRMEEWNDGRKKRIVTSYRLHLENAYYLYS
jgi:hypothetical protein